MLIRPIRNNEIMLLAEFLYEAIFQRDTSNLASRTIIQDPSLWIYVDEFGSKPDDHCFVAEFDGKIVGAVWVRCIKAFGHIQVLVIMCLPSVFLLYFILSYGRGLLTGFVNSSNLARSLIAFDFYFAVIDYYCVIIANWR